MAFFTISDESSVTVGNDLKTKSKCKCKNLFVNEAPGLNQEETATVGTWWFFSVCAAFKIGYLTEYRSTL